ncbi:MAG: membrane protein insertion efficiency factor YidD [Alphaproteobacteria bacterium PA3]|nr:MAG: membrane protein insertion efficiency factor YidD [Alphaproteobacteria bacterium PA3]
MAQATTLSVAARVLLVAQRVYKVTLSPLIGQQCRYLPSCSDYAADCVRQFGAWRGSWMGFARLCRCRPGGGTGYDPAPASCEPVSALTPWRYGDWKLGARLADPNRVDVAQNSQNTPTQASL